MDPGIAVIIIVVVFTIIIASNYRKEDEKNRKTISDHVSLKGGRVCGFTRVEKDRPFHGNQAADSVYLVDLIDSDGTEKLVQIAIKNGRAVPVRHTVLTD